MGTAKEQPTESYALGVVIIVATVFAMSFADAIVKYVSADFPLWQIYVVRSLVAIPAIIAILICHRRSIAVRPKSFGWTYLRSLLLALMYIAIYAGVPVLSLSVIAAALYTGPLFITLFSALLIGEAVKPRQWVAILIGFAGVLVILRPDSDAFSFATLIPIIAALFYALAAIITRSKCVEEEPLVLALSLNFCLLAVGTLVTAAILFWAPSPEQEAVYPFLLGYWIEMGAREWGIITLLAGLIVLIGIGLAKAYQSGPPTIIATFDYSYMIFAAFWGYAIFADIPDLATIIGMAMIAAAGLLVIHQPASQAQSHGNTTQTAGNPS